MTIRIGLVGVGKIARDQHAPTIAASRQFELVATASHHGALPGVPSYPSLETMLAGPEAIDAVALCVPPQARFELAWTALRAGKHVLLEKPPGATLSEVEALTALAQASGATLFAAWHSRFAAGVSTAREWLRRRRIESVTIDWKEDVRVWHPGQQWIWRPGGLGVFDPGINALSIATEILPPFRLTQSILSFPENKAAPIAAELTFAGLDGWEAVAIFDFRETGPQIWDIQVATDDGVLRLANGGEDLSIQGVPQRLAADGEYPALYRRFAALIGAGHTDVDLAPLRHVADAFLSGTCTFVAPFED